MHDSTIFDNSQLRAMLETQQTHGYLVGDSGYACRRYMLTPLNNPNTAAEQAYISALVLAQNCIERTIGVLKRRFPALKYGLRLKLSNTLPVIVATVVLHNIAVTLGEDEPGDDDDQLQQYAAEKRLQLLADRGAGDNQSTNADINPPAATGMRRALIDSYLRNRTVNSKHELQSIPTGVATTIQQQHYANKTFNIQYRIQIL